VAAAAVAGAEAGLAAAAEADAAAGAEEDDDEEEEAEDEEEKEEADEAGADGEEEDATWSPTPRRILPQPIRRQCLSTRRDKASFSPSDEQTGAVKATLAKSSFSCNILAPVEVDPMLSIRISPFVSFLTLF